jgi:GT2 family glycosyltransferase/spore maturation protein CgeB
MDIRRVALIYDDTSRPETTGTYCRRALGELVEVEHYRPADFERIPRSGFDLYLSIDDGLEYLLPAELRPAAWWAIDTHLNFARCVERSRDCDRVFAAQRDGAAKLADLGIAASWLPLACDPSVHGQHEIPKRYDIAFVGNLFPGPREELVNRLRWTFRDVFVGNAYFEAMAEIYSASRLVFNRSLRDDVNMRVFEALSCGSLLLTNDLTNNGQAELFEDGVHLATYRDAEDLLDKAAYYLKREEVRERIAASGRAEVLAKHTYRHRMEALLRAAEADLGKVRVAASVAPVPVPHLDLSYYSHARPEILALVPVTARRVLDVGCGAGRLGEAIKARQGAEVVGIELAGAAASAALGRLDRVVVGDAERIDPRFGPDDFDCVVCGDVLEHLEDPGAFLRRARGWLSPDGVLVTSLPNARHHQVVAGLLEGNWTYESAGLLDETHLQFFTRRDAIDLLEGAGFRIERVFIVPGPGHAEWRAAGSPGEVRIGRLHITGLPPEEIEEFHAYQFLFEARPRGANAAELTSIVIRTSNGLEFTRRCVESVQIGTDEPYELIFVDNGSTDGTVEYLRRTVPSATLLENRENRGIPAAANQGIRAARGRQIVLLDNDAVVTRGWLRKLLAVLERDPSTGLVGPCTNWPEGDQQVELGYRDLADLDRSVREWSRGREGRSREVAELNGFCLLIHRELINRVGLFDESYGLGLCEDKDYCQRSTAAGYRNWIADDAFVHHFGGRTFAANGVDTARLFTENRKRFRDRWEPSPSPAVAKATVNPVKTDFRSDAKLATKSGGDRLRIAFLGNFEQAWSTEGYAAEALERIGHEVHRIHEYGVADAREVLDRIDRFGADCLLFFKGRIGVDPTNVGVVLRPDPARLVEVLRRSPVPGYLWYFDRVHGYDAEPSRAEWMRRVAPLCRVAFVTDGGLATTPGANWRVLRQGISRPTVEEVEVPEDDRDDLAFVGQVYGDRRDEIEVVRREFPLRLVSDVFGQGLSRVIRRHRIILGPRYPGAPGYWSDRIYVVLGHGGFFLAPEVPGMREEGFEPGVHYAPLGDDPIRDIRDWLARPRERERIARQGRELVLGRFTYEDRVQELAAAILATLPRSGNPGNFARPVVAGEAFEAGATPQSRRPSSRPEPIAGPGTVPGRARRAGPGAGGPALRFRHRRKLGDVIYALPAVRHLGGGTLYLDPASHDGARDEPYWRRQFESLIPFLRRQPYLKEVRLYEGEDFDVDLDAYLQTSHGTPGDRVSIVANHFVGLGLEPPAEIASWLVAAETGPSAPIVVHRSPRYRGPVDYSFLEGLEGRLSCVGSESERAPFEAIGARPLVTDGVDALAGVIRKCGVFIGNQSLPLALAAGLGAWRMIEESPELPNVALGDDRELVLTDSAETNRTGLARLLARAGLRPEEVQPPRRPVPLRLQE